MVETPNGALRDQVAIISGGAGGIGAATARRFVAEGAKVLIGDIAIEQGTALAEDLGDDGYFTTLDVTKREDWAAAVASCQSHFGAPSILINNAGVMVVNMIESSSEEDFRRAFEINVLGPVLGTQAVIQPMAGNGGGSIVVMSSSASLQGAVGLAPYSASKAGNAAFAKTAALELAKYKIRVNSLHPGAVDTPMSNAPEYDAMDKDAFYGKLPIPRMGAADEVAEAMLFLASPRSSYMTGAALVIDGGQTAGVNPFA